MERKLVTRDLCSILFFESAWVEPFAGVGLPYKKPTWRLLSAFFAADSITPREELKLLVSRTVGLPNPTGGFLPDRKALGF